MFTLTYSYSRRLLRRYYFREVWRTQRGWLLALPILLAMVVWTSTDPRFWWFAGFLGGLCLAYVLMVYAGYRQLELFPIGHEATTTLDEAGLRFSSILGVSDIPWAAIKSCRETKDGLVLTSRFTARPVLLPSTALSPEAAAFVMRNVREKGATARDGD